MHRSNGRGWPDDDVEVPPHSLDLDAIVRIGRRQVRRQRMAVVGGTAAVLAAVAAVPAAVPLRPSGGGGAGESPTAAPLPVLDCDVTELPLPEEYADPEPGSFASVVLTAMDPTGRYAIGDAYHQRYGEADDESDPEGVVLWDDGRAAAPARLRGDYEARDVNADGVVVGRRGGDDVYGWIYRDDRLTQLPAPGGYDSTEAIAINAAGDVVGTATGRDGLQTAVMWPADDLHHPHVLAAPPGHDVSARGVTDDGRVVGEYRWDDDGEWPAETGVYLWEPDGTRVELPEPDGAYDIYGTAVRGNWAIGQALTEPEGPQAGPASATGSMSLLWNLSTRTLRVVAGGGSVPNQVWDVSAAGDLLFIMPPAVIRDGEPHALPDPIGEGAVVPPDAAYTPQVGVTAISDDGSTIAGDVYINLLPAPVTQLLHPVLWRC